MDRKKLNLLRKQNLARIMLERGLHPVDLAEMTGKTISYIGQVLNLKHKTPIGPSALKNFCDVLNVDPEEFHRPIDGEPSRQEWAFSTTAVDRWPVLKHIVMAANNGNDLILEASLKQLYEQIRKKRQ